MNNRLFILIILITLVQFGCEKEKEDIRPILTAKSWEEIEGTYNEELNGLNTFIKVTFDHNGEFEFIFRRPSIMFSEDTTGMIRIDTLLGEYDLIDSENRITFKPKKSLVTRADTFWWNAGCDTVQRFIGDWHIMKIRKSIIEIQGDWPDTSNSSTCAYFWFIDDYNFKPYEE